VRTSKRIAEAYMQLGQLSSAILEYEGILQRFPDDPDVQTALADIEIKASNLAVPGQPTEADERAPATIPFPSRRVENRSAPTEVVDGREMMKKIFVEGRHISEADFARHWPRPSLDQKPSQPIEPFLHALAEHQIVATEVALKLLMEKSRLCYLPIEKYDLDVDTARGFPRETCLRWCVLPFDRMSKSVLIATANPFNKHVARELESCVEGRLLWYLAAPAELMKALRKVFR
jgi:hypothetical protein